MNIKISFNFGLITSVYLLGMLFKYNSASKVDHTNCSLKNNIPDQVIDINSEYSYIIDATQVFNGEILFLKVIPPFWLKYCTIVPTREEYDLWSQGQGGRLIAITDNMAYVQDSLGLNLINITDDLNPTLLYTRSGVNSMQILGNIAYVASGWDGLKLFDVTNEMNPTLLTSFKTDAEVRCVTVLNDVAYLSLSVGGLQLIDINNVRKLSLLESITIKEPLYGGYCIKVAENIGYIVAGVDLQLIDVSSPRKPVLSGSIAGIGYGAEEVKLVKNIAYVAAGFEGLKLIDISNASNPKTIAYAPKGYYDFHPEMYYAFSVEIIGDIAYLAAGNAGLQLIDISDPFKPKLLTYDLNSYAQNVIVVGNVVYVSGYPGLQIINPKHGKLLGPQPKTYISYEETYTLTATATDYNGNDCVSTFKITVDQLPIFTNKIQKQKVFPKQFTSISLPLNTLCTARGVLKPLINFNNNKLPLWLNLTLTPDLIGQYSYTNSQLNNFLIIDAKAYIAGSIGLLILDISSNTGPFLIGSYLTSSFTIGLSIIGTNAYLATQTGLQLINISNPRNPSWLGSYYPLSSTTVAATNNLLLVADFGLKIINYQDGSPIKAVRFKTTGSPNEVIVIENIAYLASGQGGLQLIDVANYNKPKLVASIPTEGDANDVTVVGSVAYVAAGVGLQLINISDTFNPKLLKYVQINSTALGVTVVGGIAYVAGGDAGLQLIDVSDVLNPVLLSCRSSIGDASKVTIVGNIAYVVASSGLKLIDISDSCSLKLLSSFMTTMTPTGGYSVNDIYGVMVVDNIAYACGFAGLELIDVKDPTNPKLLSTVRNEKWWTGEVEIKRNIAYVAAGYAGLQLIDISDVFNPVLLASVPTVGYASGITVVGDIAYVVNFDEKMLELFNIVLPISYKISAPIKTIDIFNNNAIISTNVDLQVINLDNLSNISLIGIYLIESIVDISISGELALITTIQEIQILNISKLINNKLYSPIGTYKPSSTPNMIKNYGNLGFIATVNGLEIIDLTNLSKPAFIATYFASTAVYAVEVIGSTAFIATGILGVKILDLSKWTISGIPPINAVGNYDLTLVVVDVLGGQAKTNFTIVVMGPPKLIKNISSQTAHVGELFNFVVFNDTFYDENYNAISYIVSLDGAGNLPAWLTFDSSILRFYGTPSVGDLNFFGNKKLSINLTAMNSGPIGSSVIYNLTVTGIPYGVMMGIITGSVAIAGIIGFAIYHKMPIIAYIWHKITNTTKCWQFDERPKANKERKQNVYLMSEEYFNTQELDYIQYTPGIVYNPYGTANRAIINQDSTSLAITLKEYEQDLLPKNIIKNSSTPKKETFKIGNPVLNLFATKGIHNCSQEYQLITVPPSSKDFKKVLECYQHHPALGYDIKSVEIIYNPSMDAAFADNLKMLQARHNNPAFVPRFLQEDDTDEERELRIKTKELWKSMAANYVDSDYPGVKLFPLWHGTRPEILPSIFKAGYANLASTDCGYFGKGLYSTYEAEYSYKYYYKGALILNWVSSYSAYPVIAGDMHKLTAKGTYQNYDTNFIPVVPYTRSNKDNFVPENPDAVDDVYLPCGVGQQSPYTEVVVFEKAQCLPRYLVTLQPTLVRSPRFLESESGSESELEKERMRKLLIRQREIILFTGAEKDYLSVDGKIINEQEMELIHRRSIFVPNSPDDLPDDSPQFSKSRGKQPLINFTKDFGFNRKSTLLEEDSLFTNAVLSEPVRFLSAAQRNYEESSSCSHLLVASTLHEDSSSSVMTNRPKTTLKEPLSMDLDEIHDAAVPLLFSVPQSTTVYPQSSNIVADPLVATVTTNFDRMSI